MPLCKRLKSSSVAPTGNLDKDYCKKERNPVSSTRSAKSKLCEGEFTVMQLIHKDGEVSFNSSLN